MNNQTNLNLNFQTHQKDSQNNDDDQQSILIDHQFNLEQYNQIKSTNANQLDLKPDNNQPKTELFEELINLLSNCTNTKQITIDDKIEITNLQKKILEAKNFNLEESIKLKNKHIDNLKMREYKWINLNSNLDQLINMMFELDCDFNKFEIKLKIEFEKKLNYLNELLKISKNSLTKDKLKNYLNENSIINNEEIDDQLSPLSIVECKNYFQIKSIKNMNYNLDKLIQLTKRVESELSNLSANLNDKLDNNFSQLDNQLNSNNFTNQFNIPSNQTNKEISSEDIDSNNKSSSNYPKIQTESTNSINEKYVNNQNSSNDVSKDENTYLDLFKESIQIEQDDTAKLDDDDEFNDDIPDDFFKNIIPCSQLANQTIKINEEEKVTQIGLTSDSIDQQNLFNQTDQQSQNFFNQTIQKEQNFFNQIDHKKQNLFNLTKQQQNSLNQIDESQNDLNQKDLELSIDSSTNRSNLNQLISTSNCNFFTDQSGESVIIKKKSKIKNNEDDEEFYNFKTSLSSQITFN